MKSNKIRYMLLLALFLPACAMTPEQKAEKAVKEIFQEVIECLEGADKCLTCMSNNWSSTS